MSATKFFISSATVEKALTPCFPAGFSLEEPELAAITPASKRKKRVIVISGPTATGKSSLAISLAKIIGGEIVNADCMQVYKGMDIGTAKPSLEEQQTVPHHLIDIRSVSHPFTVIDFYYEARRACQHIFSRDNTPIIVGGSGFYIHTLIYGPPIGPPPVPEIRKALEDEWEKLGSAAMYAKLIEQDPQYAETITKNDKQKILRGLEIIAILGKKVSKLAWKTRRKPQHYEFHCWFLYRPREHLYRRINQRCEQMINQGLLTEVEQLIHDGIYNNSSATQAIGYRQALEFLKSQRTEADYHHFIADFKKASRHYAKRQFTWFRNEPLFRWLDLEMHDPEIALEIIQRDFELL